MANRHGNDRKDGGVSTAATVADGGPSKDQGEDKTYKPS